MPKIEIIPLARHEPNQSNHSLNKFSFSYTIRIQNNNKFSVKLIARSWHITDANGKVNKVHGVGVVGDQPEIDPGKEYTYSSWIQLSTPVGSMQGAYQFIDDKGKTFEVEIKPFSLAIKNLVH